MSPKTKHRVRRSRKPPASGRKPVSKLKPGDVQASAEDLVAYHALFHPVFRRREQRRWSLFYLCGQLSNLERKTIEPMVLGLQGNDRDMMRAVQQFIGQSTWPTCQMILRLQELVDELLGDPAGILIVDGSGFPKQGQDSAGVAPQYCGHLGKTANCQEGVFLVYWSPRGQAFLDGRLYVPERWFDADHRARWTKCGIPDDLHFETEPALGLQMVREVVARGIPPVRWIAADAHFGQNTAFLDGIAALDQWYLAEVPRDTRVWLRRPRVEPPGRGPSGHWRKRPRVAENVPTAQELQALAAQLPPSAWMRRTIKEGSKGPLVAEFAFRRVIAVRDALPGPDVWAVFRRSLSDPPELKYYLSNAPITCSRDELVAVSGLRWPIETSLEEAKGEAGMDHYETRSWLGWHHHMAHTFIAHLFLVRQYLKLKKKPRADYRASPAVDCSSHRRRPGPVARRTDRHPLPAMAQLRRLPFTPQKHTQAALPQVALYAEVS